MQKVKEPEKKMCGHKRMKGEERGEEEAESKMTLLCLYEI